MNLSKYLSFNLTQAHFANSKYFGLIFLDKFNQLIEILLRIAILFKFIASCLKSKYQIDFFNI